MTGAVQAARARRRPRVLARCATTAAIAVLASTCVTTNVGAAPRVHAVRAEPGDVVGLFAKLEISFRVENTTAERPQWPFDPAPPSGVPAGVGISVDAVFVDPDGQRFSQPAFYAEEFVSEIREGRDWHLPTGIFTWTVRFSPNRAGTWTYSLVATDRGGSTTTAPRAFEVARSPAKGFVRTSARDGRYFEFDDGTLFAGMGFTMPTLLGSPDTQGAPQFARLADAGVAFVRLAVSSIFGSAWHPWIGARNAYRGYLPVTGLVPDRDPSTGEVALAMRLAADDPWFDACRTRLWWEDQAESVKRRTTYRVSVTYRGVGISGPRETGTAEHGLVLKLDDEWHPGCDEPGTGTPVTAFGGNTEGIASIEGKWFSGDRVFLPRPYLALENVRQGSAFVYAISLREDLGGGRLGPEVMIVRSMQREAYIPEEKAFSLDRIVEHAERHGVYLKLVVMDKNDKIYFKLRDDGSWVMDGPDNATGFYGLGRGVNKTRWLQQVWWRYLQARWGYSPSVHSWELTNEGDPASTRHYEMADEFGKYMHCRVFGVEPGRGDGVRCGLRHPNAHLVTTSLWTGFPAAAFWANDKYPNVDYADLHAYVSTSFAPAAEREAMQWDSARYHEWHSRFVAAAGVNKPVVRGEAGLDGVADQSESALRLSRDTSGVWLHNLLWSTLGSGGLYELYWWTSHIWSDSHDLRDMYGAVARFIADVPLNAGGYVDWGGSVSTSALRVLGQKNAALGTMHLWVQNRAYTWKNVVDGVPFVPVSGQIRVPGFAPGRTYVLERWRTAAPPAAIRVEHVASDASGAVLIAIDALATDVAFKLRPSGPAERTPGATAGRR